VGSSLNYSSSWSWLGNHFLNEDSSLGLATKRFYSPKFITLGYPALFVSKKDRDLHLCVDYRLLNVVTIKNK
jgi:hypothetical protein